MGKSTSYSRFENHILVCRYLKEKPPGQQTVVDFCIQFGINVWTLRILESNICIYISLLYGKLNFQFGLFLIFIQNMHLLWQVACGQMVLVLKAIIIFKAELLEEFSDQAIIWGFRTATVCYAIFWGVFGYVFAHAGPRSPIILFLMTGSKETT